MHGFDGYSPGSARSTSYALSMSAAAEVGFDLVLNKHLLPWPAPGAHPHLPRPHTAPAARRHTALVMHAEPSIIQHATIAPLFHLPLMFLQRFRNVAPIF